MIAATPQSRVEAHNARPEKLRAAAQPMLVVDNLSKSYIETRIKWGKSIVTAELRALENIGFTVAPGEIVTLLGPSGCGKTTLLRIMAGLASATRGQILLDGTGITGPDKNRAFVFQHFGLLPWRDVLDNVAYPLELDGVPKRKRHEIAEKYIRLVGLSGFERHHPHSLSGGMQQRVGIARALTRDPRLLLMDEPFGALDAQTREIMQEQLIDILETTRNTVICVTHSISEAVFLSNKVVVFSPHPGRVKRVVEIPRIAEETPAARRASSRAKDIERQLRDLLRGDEHEG